MKNMATVMFALDVVTAVMCFTVMFANLCISNFGIAWLWLIGFLYSVGNLIAILVD